MSPQILHTKDYGSLEVVRSFMKGNIHIVELANGAYAHATGLPVQSKEELREAIPQPYLEKALHWWEHRNDVEEAPKRSILIRPDGSLCFDDGTPVKTISEIIEHIPPGPFLDAAVASFSRIQAQAAEIEKAAKRPGGKAAKAVVRRKVPSKTPKASPKTVSPPETQEGNEMKPVEA